MLPTANSQQPIAVNLDDMLFAMFRQGAEGPDEYDCYTAAVEIRRRAGLTTPTRRQLVEAALVGKSLFRRLDYRQPWCLVFFNMEPRHVGVLLPGLTEFYHITRQAGPAINKINSWPWSNKIEGYYEVIA